MNYKEIYKELKKELPSLRLGTKRNVADWCQLEDNFDPLVITKTKELERANILEINILEWRVLAQKKKIIIDLETEARISNNISEEKNKLIKNSKLRKSIDFDNLQRKVRKENDFLEEIMRSEDPKQISDFINFYFFRGRREITVLNFLKLDNEKFFINYKKANGEYLGKQITALEYKEKLFDFYFELTEIEKKENILKEICVTQEDIELFFENKKEIIQRRRNFYSYCRGETNFCFLPKINLCTLLSKQVIFEEKIKEKKLNLDVVYNKEMIFLKKENETYYFLTDLEKEGMLNRIFNYITEPETYILVDSDGQRKISFYNDDFTIERM